MVRCAHFTICCFHSILPLSKTLGDQMSFFSIFKKKKPKADAEFKDYAKKVMEDFQKNDFLGKAAEAGHKAKAAVKSKKYDEALGVLP